MWPFASKSDVRNEIEASRQSLITELRQLIPPPPAPTPTFTQDYALHQKMDRLERQIEGLAKIVNQTMPTMPDGSAKPVHERIESYLLSASNALDQLKQEHALWLEEQQKRLDLMKPTLEQLFTQHGDAVHHILPKKDELPVDTGPIPQA